MKRAIQQDIVPVESPKKIEQELLDEAIATFDIFKRDEATLAKAIKERNEQIDVLRQEQSQDVEKLLRTRGALSALQHLITSYKNRIYNERK